MIDRQQRGGAILNGFPAGERKLLELCDGPVRKLWEDAVEVVAEVNPAVFAGGEDREDWVVSQILCGGPIMYCYRIAPFFGFSELKLKKAGRYIGWQIGSLPPSSQSMVLSTLGEILQGWINELGGRFVAREMASVFDSPCGFAYMEALDGIGRIDNLLDLLCSSLK